MVTTGVLLKAYSTNLSASEARDPMVQLSQHLVQGIFHSNAICFQGGAKSQPVSPFKPQC